MEEGKTSIPLKQGNGNATFSEMNRFFLGVGGGEEQSASLNRNNWDESIPQRLPGCLQSTGQQQWLKQLPKVPQELSWSAA